MRISFTSFNKYLLNMWHGTKNIWCVTTIQVLSLIKSVAFLLTKVAKLEIFWLKEEIAKPRFSTRISNNVSSYLSVWPVIITLASKRHERSRHEEKKTRSLLSSRSDTELIRMTKRWRDSSEENGPSAFAYPSVCCLGLIKERKRHWIKHRKQVFVFCDNLGSILIYLVVKYSDLLYFFCTLLYRRIFCFCSTQFCGRKSKSTRSSFLKKQTLFSRFLQRHTCTDCLIRNIAK